jgi:YHS domain-containing protein
MNRLASLATVVLIAVATLVSLTAWDPSPSARADDDAKQSIPAVLAPFEYLVGRWTGHGVPKDSSAQQFRGWDEAHAWAWLFAKGELIGLSVTIEGGKVLAKGKLTFDAVRGVYRLEGIEPEPGGPIAFEGTIDKSSKHLVLDRVSLPGNTSRDGAKVRLSFWPNANFIRYTMAEEVQERGAFRYGKVLEVGLTREGESLAAPSGTVADRPKCIVTGGAATMTLSYQGRSYPVCCTGCRDEFNDNPDKYIKKASLMKNSQAGDAKSGQPSSSRVNRFDDAFADDVVTSTPSDTSSSQSPGARGASSKNSPKPKGTAEGSAPQAKKQAVNRPDPGGDRSAGSKKASRASTLLKLGQSLEKAGNTTAALGYFRQVVKDFPGTPAAKTAAERIKAIEAP